MELYKAVTIYFYGTVFVEYLMRMLIKKRRNLKETVTSLNHGIFCESIKFFAFYFEIPLYLMIYNNTGSMLLNVHMMNHWQWTCITLILVDYVYYWAHRFSHEIHFLWAFHQVHHSSEQFDIAVGVRHSIVEYFIQCIFYLPLVVFLEPHYVMLCRELIALYHLWLHTEVVSGYDELAWIFNTPRHHRVHHGCNALYQNKNYGGIFIIWDRMFSTFQKEKLTMTTIYGLESSPKYYDICYQQFIGFANLIKKSFKMKNIRDKLATFVMGPTWLPGLPRLGDVNNHVRLEDRKDRIKNRWHLYFTAVMHFTLFINGYEMYLLNELELDWSRILDGFANLFITLCTCGLFFNGCSIVIVSLLEFIHWALVVFYYYPYPRICVQIYHALWHYYGFYFVTVIINSIRLLIHPNAN